MTLMVYPFRRGSDGELIRLEVSREHNDLAGFEVCRTTLWGSEAARALGLTLLPSLADTDVYAEEEDLNRLEIELATLRNALALVVERTGYREDFIRQRVDNIAEAVAVAREQNGGVYIG
jgi:hypothetical protein